jgi:two-component system sensor histidine kinase QseC
MKRLFRVDSLQARLRALVLGLVTVVWMGAAVVTWLDARHELDELLDGHLAQAAALLVAQQTNTHNDQDGDGGEGLEDAPSLHKYAPRVAFQVFHEGRLVLRSANAGITPLSSTLRGYATVQLADHSQWRVFAARGNERDVQVFVAEQTMARDAILWAILRSVILPLIFALPLLALVLWWAVRRGLAPVRELSHVLAQRPAQTLEPVVIAELPSEMRPMVQSLNGLLARIEHMVMSERRFTADAAHELRTPIAGIRAQAQVALGAGDDLAQREHALLATLAGCDRATRVVDQLLTLARIEAASGQGHSPLLPIDVSELARRVAADLAPRALARQQSLALDAPAVCLAAADDTLASLLLRNLIDNALLYSPPGARIVVSVAADHGQTLLQVQDSGTGMADPDLARLGERFFRVLGNGQPGSGLGWSIIQRIADVSGAKIQTGRSKSLGGMAVSVFWPGNQGNSPQG